MLNYALEVVQAARDLKLEKSNGKVYSTLSPLDLAVAIGTLQMAIESFDKNTARDTSSPLYKPKPDFAAPPQLADEEFIEHQEDIEAGETLNLTSNFPEDMEPDLEEIDLGLFDPSPEAADSSYEVGKSSSFTPTLSISAATLAASSLDLDTLSAKLDQGADTVVDFMESMQAIEQRLDQSIQKMGWTPRLKALAEAARDVQSNLHLDIQENEAFVRVPAKEFAILSATVANAVTGRNEITEVPVPKVVSKQVHNLYDVDESLSFG